MKGARESLALTYICRGSHVGAEGERGEREKGSERES